MSSFSTLATIHITTVKAVLDLVLVVKQIHSFFLFRVTLQSRLLFVWNSAFYSNFNICLVIFGHIWWSVASVYLLQWLCWRDYITALTSCIFLGYEITVTPDRKTNSRTFCLWMANFITNHTSRWPTIVPFGHLKNLVAWLLWESCQWRLGRTVTTDEP